MTHTAFSDFIQLCAWLSSLPSLLPRPPSALAILAWPRRFSLCVTLVPGRSKKNPSFLQVFAPTSPSQRGPPGPPNLLLWPPIPSPASLPPELPTLSSFSTLFFIALHLSTNYMIYLLIRPSVEYLSPSGRTEAPQAGIFVSFLTYPKAIRTGSSFVLNKLSVNKWRRLLRPSWQPPLQRAALPSSPPGQFRCEEERRQRLWRPPQLPWFPPKLGSGN